MTDDLAAFHRALPGHLARAVTLDHATIPALKAALERKTAVELARICSLGITRKTANPRGLVLFRLRREAGLLDQDGDT